MLDHASAQEQQLWRNSRCQLEAAAADPAMRRQANRLLWEICQVLHEPDAAMSHLWAALRDDPLFIAPPREGSDASERSVLALMVPGDFQSNLPLERLFDQRTDLHTLWLCDPQSILGDPAASLPRHLPPIDCVFIAIAEASEHRLALRAADALAAAIPAATINRGARIALLSRTGTVELLRGLPDAVVPSHHLVHRGASAPIAYPLIIRPLGSHAGHGLCRIETDPELAHYYAAHPASDRFTIAPFIDYRSADGAWRKYRLIFVDNVAYPLHLAIHDDWAVWYYNARMQDAAGKLREERMLLENFAGIFPRRAQATLSQLAERIGLDYFGLDCAVLPDGRLLVFEIETGMIVHDRSMPGSPLQPADPGVRIRRAVERMIDRRRFASSA